MATELNANSLQGVKIHKLPSDSNFTSDRLAIAANPDTGKLYKVTMEQWVSMLSGLNVSYKGSAETDTDPGTPSNPEFYTATATGTYTNFKDSSSTALEIADGDGFVIFSFDGTNWSKHIVDIPTPQNKIDNWTARAYSNNDQVVYNGQIWKANDTVTSDDIPGTSDKWDAVLSALMAADYLAYSANLIDNSKILAGGYLNADGTVYSDTDSIRTPLIPIDATKGKISVGGVGATINSYAGRFVFFDAAGAFISYSNSLTNVSIPEDSAYVGITIAFGGTGSGIGDDPTNSAYKDTMIANYGATASAWIAYGSGIDAAKIFPSTLDTAVQNTDSVTNLKSFTDGVKFNSSNIFDKSDCTSGSINIHGAASPSDNWVVSGFIPISANTNYAGGSFTNNNASSTLAIAFYDSSKAFISGIAMSGLTKYSATSPSNAAYMRCTIANVVNIGLTPTDNSYVNNFMLNEGGSVLDWEPGPAEPYIDADKVYGLEVSSPVYVSYATTSSLVGNKEVFTIYVQRGNSNRYVGFELRHDYDMSEMVYTDQYRIGIAKEYIFSGGVMNLASSDLVIVEGESECVYFEIGSTDHTGGVHGDEILSQVTFYVDGIPLTTDDLSENFSLKPCQKFEYIQISTTHKTSTDGVNPVEGHPSEATHHKRTTFSNSGYQTFNRLIWLGAFDINYWYHGICCVGKIQASVGFDESFQQITFSGSTDMTDLALGNREMNYYDATNKLSAKVTSTLLKNAATDPSCQMFVWDRATDSKYYRQTPETTTSENETWESIMTVTFYQKS